MSILVTGGTGLVGKALLEIKKSNNSWFFASSKDANLKNIEETEQLFEKIKPKYVIHLAASVGGLYKNLNNNLEMFEDNFDINIIVIKTCHKYGVKRAIFCLSTCVFPDNIGESITEDMLHHGPPHLSNYGYSYSKRMLQIQCQLYNEKYNTQYICIIPTNIYGENDNFTLENSHVIPGLIHQCYLAKKNNTPFIIKGTGTPLRQFLYSKDLAKAIELILYNYKATTSIIISPKEEISITTLARTIMDNFNYHNFKYDTSYSDGQHKKTNSNLKLLTHFPDFQFTNFNLGIRNTINWFIENYQICRK